MADKIIYRTDKDEISRCLLRTFYTSIKEFEDELPIISIFRYFGKPIHLNEHYNLHIYRIYLDDTWMFGTTKSVYIVALYEKVTKNAFYLDFLYYKDVMNYSNFVIYVNRKYFIDLNKIGLLKRNNYEKTRTSIININEESCLKLDTNKVIYMEYIFRN